MGLKKINKFHKIKYIMEKFICYNLINVYDSCQ